MAEKNLMSYTVSSVLIGVLLMGMLTFYISIVNNEGRGEIFDDYPNIESLNQNVTSFYESGKLLNVSNQNINISSNWNAEFAVSGGDKSGNAIAISLQDLVVTSWNLIGVLGGMLFGNTLASIISSILISIVAFMGTYYFIKWIRTGT